MCKEKQLCQIGDRFVMTHKSQKEKQAERDSALIAKNKHKGSRTQSRATAKLCIQHRLRIERKLMDGTNSTHTN